MELGFTPPAGLGDRQRDAAIAPGVAAPEWAALRARFAAIHGLRRSLEVAAETARVLGGGSFLCAADAVLGQAPELLPGVNLDLSANRKAPAGIHETVANEPPRGDQGR